MTVDPDQLHIRTFPDPALRAKSREVDPTTEEVRAVAHRMIELMHKAPGVGLAANQVGLDWRLFVVDVSPDSEDDLLRSLEATPPSATDGPQVYINPSLSGYARDLVPFTEGCLSLPDIEGEVRRPSQVSISAIGINGAPVSMTAGGLLARVLQHENDHLDGVLIIDRMVQADRKNNQRRVRELEDSAQELRQ